MPSWWTTWRTPAAPSAWQPASCLRFVFGLYLDCGRIIVNFVLVYILSILYISTIHTSHIIHISQAGATKVYAILTHGIFSGPALQRLECDQFTFEIICSGFNFKYILTSFLGLPCRGWNLMNLQIEIICSDFMYILTSGSTTLALKQSLSPTPSPK